MKKKKQKIKYTNFTPVNLLGIVCFDRSYQIGWKINKTLNFNLVADEDILIKNKNETISFTSYFFEDEERMIFYRLIANHPETSFFIKKLKNIDYVLLIQGELTPDEINTLVKKLQKIESFRAVVKIDVEKLSLTMQKKLKL
ncbi:MAG: hypothetical protein CSA05_00405 [Bacteroidia bacterium]|nr:MAG: hypothetical protein CSB01_01100 [Bacteroidia bacterium]PIE86468.1 MAG: hypothetical protein CSA05_00405 [Bacteroidia bacterium]